VGNAIDLSSGIGCAGGVIGSSAALAATGDAVEALEAESRGDAWRFRVYHGPDGILHHISAQLPTDLLDAQGWFEMPDAERVVRGFQTS